MKRSLHMLTMVLIFPIAIFSLVSCGGRGPIAPTPPTPASQTDAATTKTDASIPAPVISLSVSPASIEPGQMTTLSWSTSNATTVTIDHGIGSVEASGSRRVSPSSSTTYVARASGPGGSTSAEARLTLTVPAPVTLPAATSLENAPWFETNIKDIFFDLDSYELRPDAQATLEGNARAFAERTNVIFSVEGHCDERGSEKYNLALGDRRANVVKEFLVKLGINPDRIDTVSYGKERQVCTEHSEECWQMNRRAHLLLR